MFHISATAIRKLLSVAREKFVNRSFCQDGKTSFCPGSILSSRLSLKEQSVHVRPPLTGPDVAQKGARGDIHKWTSRGGQQGLHLQWGGNNIIGIQQ